MQLVANARHLQPADDLTVGGALRVRVNGRQVVRLLDAGADIEGDCVKELLARGFHRLRRRRITRPAAMRSAMLSHVAPPSFASTAARVTQSAAARSDLLSRFSAGYGDQSSVRRMPDAGSSRTAPDQPASTVVPGLHRW